MKAEKRTSAEEARGIQVRGIILDDSGTQGDLIRRELEGSLASVSSRTGINYNFPLPLVTANPEEVFEIIDTDKDIPDWIFCDLNLGKKGAGLAVANRIAKQLYPTDVLLYTYAGIVSEGIKLQDNRYGISLVANHDQITGRIEWLVWRTMVRLSDPEYVRGLLLSRATDVESKIDDCLASFFMISEGHIDYFKWGLLRGEGYNWLHKYGILSEGLKDMGTGDSSGLDLAKLEKHLKDIFGLRNQVAHGIAQSDSSGGLSIKNRAADRTKGSDVKVNDVPKVVITRERVKQVLHLCYKVDDIFSNILDNLQKKRSETK